MGLRELVKDRWYIIVFFISLYCFSLLVAYGYGFFTAEHRLTPYHKISFISEAVLTKYGLRFIQMVKSKKHQRYPFVWFPTREEQSGVTLYQQNMTYNGYTFFSDNTPSAYLIDMSGNIIHQWHKPFYEVWPYPEHVTPYLPSGYEQMIFWIKAHLFPNGDVVAIYTGAFWPYGGGIIKIDADSNLLWKSAVNAHHDFDVSEDGRIYVLTHKYNYDLKNARIDDYITILSSEGEMLEEISLYEAIRSSPYAKILPDDCYGDYLHSNNLDLLTEEKASGFPFLEAGDILLSHNHLGAITVLDGENYSVKWMLAGLGHIHDPDFLDSGRIVYFENKWVDIDGIGGSRIVEWDCLLHYSPWDFTPIDYFDGIHKHLEGWHSFFSLAFGAQQKLPNDNYLITVSTAGKLVEISEDKDVVWKYVTTSLDGDSIGALHRAKRFHIDDILFLNKKTLDKYE